MPALGFIRRQRAENHGYWIILPEHLRLKSRAVQDGVPMHKMCIRDRSKRVRFMAGVTASFSFVFLLICFFCEKTDAEKTILWKVLWKVYRNIAGLILLAGVVAGFVVNRNFDYWFTWFHEKVFTNRLWMFDAEKDYMIRMLPEGFFSDMATWSLWIFGAGAVITGGFLWVKSRKETMRSSVETFRMDN